MNSKNLWPEIKQLCYELRENKVKFKDIQAKLKDELWISLSNERIWAYWKEIKEKTESKTKTIDKTLKDTWEIIDDLQSKQAEKEDGWLMEIALADNTPKKYDVSERHYIFYKWETPYKVLISTVRAIFESYSKYWQNLSGEEIRQKFKLPAGIFELIKNATWLYKSSLVDDPVTIERLWNWEWLEEYLEGKMERVIEDKYQSAYDRAIKGKLNRDLEKAAKSKRWYETFMTEFKDTIKEYKPVVFDITKLPKIDNNDTKDVFITDAHIWKLGTDWIITRFEKVARDAINSPEKNINITFGWDLAECFVPMWEMHPGQRLWMEDYTTPELVMKVVDILEKMLVSIYKSWKTVTFNGMWWNHDRFTEQKEFDPFRTPAVLIYTFLQRLLEQTEIKINILRDKANIIKEWNVKYVFIHWDGTSDAEIKRRALNDIEDWYYLVYVTWDKHHYKQIELSDRVLRIQSPALAWKGQYDSSLWMSSLPWAVEFTKNEDWMIEIHTKRYK